MADRSSTAAGNDPVAASTLNIIAGIWIILSPFIFGFWNLAAPSWASVIVGVAVVVLAAIRVAAPMRNVGLSWINFLLGIWLVISPWVFGYAMRPRMVWNDVILGVIVGVLALWSAVATRPRAAGPRP